MLLNNTLQNLNEENHHFVVLDGSTDLLGRFSAITNKELYLGSPFFFGFVKVIKHKKWDPNKRFSSHNLKLSYKNGNLLVNFPGSFLANRFFYYLNRAHYLLVYRANIWNGFRDHKQFQTYLRSLGKKYYKFIKKFDENFKPGSVMTFDTWK